MKIAFTKLLPVEGFNRLKEHELYVPMEEADVLVSTFNFPVTREVVARMPRLRLVANYAVGYNNIDLDVCREKGIRVTNTPLPVLEPTAELAFSMMCALARRISELDRNIRNHTAEPMDIMNNLGHSVYGKTLGIIGFGRIGQALARRAVAAGMKVIYHNRKPLDLAHLPERNDLSPELRNIQHQAVLSAQYVSFDELVANADIVSLNLPYSAQVHHLIGENEFKHMKSSAMLINTARGPHVDEQALAIALREHQIAGAALDVYENEPDICPDLLSLDNVILVPHIGSGTWEARLDMCENVTDNILAFADGRLQDMNLIV